MNRRLIFAVLAGIALCLAVVAMDILGGSPASIALVSNGAKSRHVATPGHVAPKPAATPVVMPAADTTAPSVDPAAADDPATEPAKSEPSVEASDAAPAVAGDTTDPHTCDHDGVRDASLVRDGNDHHWRGRKGRTNRD